MGLFQLGLAPLVLLGCMVVASPVPSLPLHPGGIGGLFKGPNAETIIKGPDGSVITAAADGGVVLTELQPIVVAEPVAVACKPNVVETVEVNAPIIEPAPLSSDLVGPSGAISTRGPHSIVAGPASTTITGPAVVAGAVIKGTPIINTGVVTPTQVPIIVETGSPITSVTATPIITASGPPVATLNTVPVLAPGDAGAAASAVVTPHLSAASASSSSSAAIATASASLNHASASVQPSGLPIISSTPATPLIPISSSITPLPAITAGPVITNNGLPIFGISDRIDFGPNPEIKVAFPSTTAAPPLGVIASATLRPNIVSHQPITNIQGLGADAIINSDIGVGPTIADRIDELEAQSALTNDLQAIADARLASQLSEAERNQIALAGLYESNPGVVLEGHQLIPASPLVRQQVISAQSASAQVATSDIQLANVPLTSVTGLRPTVLSHDSWPRLIRQTDDKKP